MRDYVARVKIKNGRIWQMMRERGIENQSELARAVGESPSEIGMILNFRKSPMGARGDWIAVVRKLADYFGCLPEEMFSPEQLTLEVKSNTRDYLLSHDDVMRLAEQQKAPELLEHSVDKDRLRDSIKWVLQTLTDRESNVLKRVYGIDCEKQSLEAIGREFDLSRERIRQIEAKAVRKLRHPTRSAVLYDFLEDEEEESASESLKEQRQKLTEIIRED